MNTEQEVFDFVVKKIIEQGGPSVDNLGMCKYRGLNGLKCAVGHLLSDEDIECIRNKGCIETIENKYMLFFGAFLPKDHVLNKFGGLIRELQKAHDLAANADDTFIDDFKKSVRDIAEVYDLKYKEG